MTTPAVFPSACGCGRRRVLGAWLLAWAPAGAAQAYDPVRRGRVLQFPRDHGAHLGAAIEW